MRIVLAASEAVPYSKTGGLADVAGALARELSAAGHEASLFVPLYGAAGRCEAEPGPGLSVAVRLGGSEVGVVVRRARGEPLVHFIDYPPFFGRRGLYGEGGTDYPDNGRRFALFSRAVLDGAAALGLRPEVFHLHDWQTGLTAALARRDPRFEGSASVFTIHNMAYQGNFPPEAVLWAGLAAEDMTPERFEFYGRLSYLKAGLVSADLVTTVSPTYAREIQASRELGGGLEGVLRGRSADLEGVLNGIETERWDPRADKALPRPYGPSDRAAGKAAARAAAARRLGLDPAGGAPLAAMIARFDRQKGIDIALEAVRGRLGRLQLAVLGEGDPALADSARALARAHPGRCAVAGGFDDSLARLLYAACDLFLIPSRFEPCGLGQMIAMRYGGLPVAARTGGLADTVREEPDGAANGFVCGPGDPDDLGRALDRALKLFGTEAWEARVTRAMTADFSWERSVRRYVSLYARALAKRRGG